MAFQISNSKSSRKPQSYNLRVLFAIAARHSTSLLVHKSTAPSMTRVAILENSMSYHIITSGSYNQDNRSPSLHLQKQFTSIKYSLFLKLHNHCFVGSNLNFNCSSFKTHHKFLYNFYSFKDRPKPTKLHL